MNKNVNGVTDFKSEVSYDLQGCLEAVVASEADKKDPYHMNNLHMDKWVTEVTDFKPEVRFI